MSDDLVKKLRREAGTLATMYAAADEIERLRAALVEERHAVPEVAIEAAQRIVTDFDIKLPRAFDALTVAIALLSRRSERDKENT